MKPGPLRIVIDDPQRDAFNAWLLLHRWHAGQIIVIKLAGTTVKREANCSTCGEAFRVTA